MSLLSRAILYASNLSAIVPIWTGRKQRGILWYYCWISFLCDAAGFTVKRMGLPRHLHVNLFFLLEFILVAWYMSVSLLNPPRRRSAMVGIIAVAAYFVIRTIFQRPLQGNYFDGAILYGLLMLVCIAALYKVIQEIEQVKIERSVLFVFSAAFLLYTSGSMMLLLFKLNLDATHRQLMTQIWDLRNVLNIIKNLAIAYIFVLQQSPNTIDRPR